MSKKSEGCTTTFVLAMIVVVFVFWLFSERGSKESAESLRLKQRQYDKALEAEVQPRVSEPINSGGGDVKKVLYGRLLSEVRGDLDSYYVEYLDVEVSESGCLWVYVIDNGKDRDGLATTLCSTAKKHYVRCVTIVDKGGNSLGRAMCD